MKNAASITGSAKAFVRERAFAGVNPGLHPGEELQRVLGLRFRHDFLQGLRGTGRIAIHELRKGEIHANGEPLSAAARVKAPGVGERLFRSSDVTRRESREREVIENRDIGRRH